MQILKQVSVKQKLRKTDDDQPKPDKRKRLFSLYYLLSEASAGLGGAHSPETYYKLTQSEKAVRLISKKHTLFGKEYFMFTLRDISHELEA